MCITRKKRNNSAKNTKKKGQGSEPQIVPLKETRRTQVEKVVESTFDGNIVREQVLEPQPAVNSHGSVIPPIVMNNSIDKVRNPLGGKNPQLSIKGKKVTKHTKQVAKKDKGTAKDSRSSQPMITDTGDMGHGNSGKENIPTTSGTNHKPMVNKEKEEAVMACMKTMYKTHGENLINRFKSLEPIRTA